MLTRSTSYLSNHAYHRAFLHHPCHQRSRVGRQRVVMLLPCTNSQICGSTCCLTLPIGMPGPSDCTTTVRSTRSIFSKSAASSLFRNTYFTNHESLPGLADAFRAFIAAFPMYANTRAADKIRDSEYQHLSHHVSLDYVGFSLFSHAQMHSSVPSTSSSPPSWQPPFFDIAYKSGNQNSQVRHGCEETTLESTIRKRIINFLSALGDNYAMVCTANRTTAFKLLAESYPFHSNKRLLTVYDHDSDAVRVMVESAGKRGADIMSASFTWPSLRINTAKLEKMIGMRKKKSRGLFVFPLQSQMTGCQYPYMWMRLAQQRGWHMVLDASALAPKDIDALGLSLIQPDFIICSFFKVYGENPSGFATLFIKKTGTKLLEPSAVARSIGVVSIVPAKSLSHLREDFSSTDSDVQVQPYQANVEVQPYQVKTEEEEEDISGSFSRSNYSRGTEDVHSVEGTRSKHKETEEDGNDGEIECRGLDHADSIGLLLINTRLRCLTNWLVIALLKLRHPHSEKGHFLVRIYGPRLKFHRGAALAFNVFDWKGEKVEPAFVQKLADRSNISLNCGFLHNILFSDKYEDVKDAVLERRVSETRVGSRKKESIDLGINVVSCSLGFLSNFEDAYKLWGFVAKFLDADFVEKERWRYLALNQKTVEV